MPTFHSKVPTAIKEMKIEKIFILCIFNEPIHDLYDENEKNPVYSWLFDTNERQKLD